MDSQPILIADDDPNDVLLVQRAFRKSGLSPSLHTVEDGETALAYLDGRPPYSDRALHPLPALVLLDLKMPRCTGFEVLEKVRATPGLRRLPIVILTASRQDADIRRAYDLGANSYLVKPVAFDMLQTMVRAINDYWLSLNQSPAIS